MRRRDFLRLTLLGAATTALGKQSDSARKPNVLFIALDDLNDWIKVLNPDAPIRAMGEDQSRTLDNCCAGDYAPRLTM